MKSIEATFREFSASSSRSWSPTNAWRRTVETEQTVAVRLPFIDEGQEPEVSLPDGTTVTVATPFTMPRRVYTLATMNSVDKSVAPLDSALRRRFHVINIAPDIEGFAESHLGLSGNPVSDGWTPASPRTSPTTAGLEPPHSR